MAGGQQERGLPQPLRSGGHSAVGRGQPCEAVSSRAGMGSDLDSGSFWGRGHVEVGLDGRLSGASGLGSLVRLQ